MRAVVELTGKKFGRLTVIKLAYVKKGRGAFWLCKCDCGSNKIVSGGSMRARMTRSCGCLRREILQKRNKAYVGENNPFWKGGRRLTKAGYVTLRMPSHPNAQSDKRVKEHVFVMSKHLGRPLRKGEIVHHKNGIRDDNRIENLELRIGNHPGLGCGRKAKKGSRVGYCIDYLRTYSPGSLSPGCLWLCKVPLN